jgi:hypothetical protein
MLAKDRVSLPGRICATSIFTEAQAAELREEAPAGGTPCNHTFPQALKAENECTRGANAVRRRQRRNSPRRAAMDEKPTKEMIDKWDRWFAVQCNNRSWDLIAKPDRSPEEDRELLAGAYASAFHWERVGTPINAARADLTVAHAHAALGNGQLALFHAQRCLSFFERGQGEDWDLAFAHAAVAYAAAVSGDASLHAKHYASAKERGANITDAEDRRIFHGEFSRIPAGI